MYISSAIFYFFVISIVYTLIKRGEQIKSNQLIITSYVILWLITIIRFDIGNDYDNYMTLIDYHIQLFNQNFTPLAAYNYFDGRTELSLSVFTYVFRWTHTPFFWVIAFYSTLFYIFIFLTFDSYKSHSTGVLLFFISGFMFCSWDWIRQGLSIIIVLYSFSCLQNKKIIIYFLCIGLAFFIHYSALVGLLFILLDRFNIKNRIAILFLLTILLLYIFNAFNNTVEKTGLYFRYLGGYDTYTDTEATVRTFSSWNYKLRTITYTMLWISMIFSLPYDSKLEKNALILGAVIFIIGSGSLVFTRISWYFIVPSFCLLKDVLKNNHGVRNIVIALMLVMSGLLFRDIAINKNCRGCSPYETIFSDEFKTQRLRISDRQ